MFWSERADNPGLFVIMTLSVAPPVAVALRNQKVTWPQNSKDVVRVSSSVTIPSLSQFTACFEILVQSQTGAAIIFSYTDKDPCLTFGNNGHSLDLILGNVTCSVSDIITLANFTSSMQMFCLTWSNVNGVVGVYFKGVYHDILCSNTVGMRTDTGGIFELGKGKKQGQNINGLVYNFRLWSSAMTFSELNALTCDSVGNVVDWDNSFWDIPASYAQTDSSLSCSESIQFSSVQFSYILFSLAWFYSVLFNSVHFDLIQFGLIQFSAIQLQNSISVLFDSIWFHWVWFDLIQFDSIQFSSVVFVLRF